MKKRTIITTSAVTIGILVLVGGIGVWLTVRSANQLFREVPQFWDTYKSKPRSYYVEFSQACDRILETYSEYKDYPLYIPVENNPALPEIIMSAEPKLITIWSDTHISITLVHIGEGKGFHITWKKNWTDNTWNLFLGPDISKGTIVYTKQS